MYYMKYWRLRNLFCKITIKCLPVELTYHSIEFDSCTISYSLNCNILLLGELIIMLQIEHHPIYFVLLTACMYYIIYIRPVVDRVYFWDWFRAAMVFPRVEIPLYCIEYVWKYRPFRRSPWIGAKVQYYYDDDPIGVVYLLTGSCNLLFFKCVGSQPRSHKQSLAQPCCFTFCNSYNYAKHFILFIIYFM